MTPADLVLRHLIERRGPVGFDALVDVALYDPVGGFYVGGGHAGRRGDFITSPEVGPLFGAVVARALDHWWQAAGEPPVFVVIEAGAGPGTLARTVLHAQPRCSSALRYVMVERSAAQRAGHADRLPLEDPASAFASASAPDDGQRAVDSPAGPIVVSLPQLPRLPGSCVVLANELLDNVPFRLAERAADGWVEVLVGIDESALVEVLVPLAGGDAAWLDELAPAVLPGARVPIQRGASAWLRDAVDLAGPDGRVVAFDYVTSTADLASRPWTEWVRTYRSHGRGGSSLEGLGTQDITCEVAIDQLGVSPTSVRSQADWLRAHGLDELVEEGRRVWRERASTGDLAAVRARSRIGEADALTDPAGLGAFRVLEWHPQKNLALS